MLKWRGSAEPAMGLSLNVVDSPFMLARDAVMGDRGELAACSANVDSGGANAPAACMGLCEAEPGPRSVGMGELGWDRRASVEVKLRGEAVRIAGSSLCSCGWKKPPEDAAVCGSV